MFFAFSVHILLWGIYGKVEDGTEGIWKKVRDRKIRERQLIIGSIVHTSLSNVYDTGDSDYKENKRWVCIQKPPIISQTTVIIG